MHENFQEVPEVATREGMPEGFLDIADNFQKEARSRLDDVFGGADSAPEAPNSSGFKNWPLSPGLVARMRATTKRLSGVSQENRETA